MTHDITHGKVEEWAAQYDGEPFHALLCDPPYHLTSITERFGKPGAAPAQHGTDGAFQRASRGFMGKDWDGGDVAFRPETWAALAQHLHPGAFGMAFAGSRGWHRMAVAIEDAGLIIHPTIFLWAYGCLSEDTEILTAKGWEPYHKAIENTPVMCYNPHSNALEWHRVQELVVYDYDETAYRIHSRDTDQIVSRNHRCLVERGGRWVFEYAERLGAVERVPYLPPSWEAWPAEEPAQTIAARKAQRLVRNLSRVRISGVEASRMAAKSQDALLFGVVSVEARARRATAAVRRQRQGQVQSEKGITRRAQPGMEGGRDLLQDARQLYGREVCALPAGVQQHGSQRRLRDGAPADRRPSDRAPTAALRSGAPYRPQPREQRAEQLAVVRQQPRSQTPRGPRRPAATLAVVTPVHYRGIVWCVRVPTGAFVARRNGKVFVTGNSGFPKATRIDTQVDRKAGAARTVVGQRKHAPKFAAAELGYREKDNGYNSRERENFDLTAPATELAAAWQGHRYGLQAMKPAVEPIIVFQKPYAGRAVDDITATGAGALWIDGGRVPGDVPQVTQGAQDRIYGNGRGLRQEPTISQPHAAGRWPANLVLQHLPTCDGDGCDTGCAVAALAAQSGERASGMMRAGTQRSTGGGYHGNMPATISGDTYGDTGTAARFFHAAAYALNQLEAADALAYVAKASSAEREAGLDPVQVALVRELYGDDLPNFDETTVDDGRETPIDNPYLRGETTRRNIHPTIKPLTLARHLATLLLPPAAYAPGRRLLVPFSGTGSEMIGGLLAGWDHISGVELDAQHVAIARARLRYWEQQRHRFDQGQPIAVKAPRKGAAGQHSLFDDREEAA